MRNYRPTDVSWDFCPSIKDLSPKERGIFLSNRNKALADLLDAALAYIVEKVPRETLREDFQATITSEHTLIRNADSFAKVFDDESRSTVIGEAWAISDGGVRTAEQAAEYTAALFDRMLDQHYETLRPMFA